MSTEAVSIGDEGRRILQAKDLSKRYGSGRLALDALNVVAHAGEIFCLLGAPGSGKSTAVRLLLGLSKPSAGRVEVVGVRMDRDPDRARALMAYVPRHAAFYPQLTARENLRLLAVLPSPRPQREKQVLREVGLPENSFDARVAALPAGERQKLALAVALLREVPVWVLDEPLAGLDAQASADLVELIDRARGQGKAILWATQDLLRAKQMADQVAILKEGRQVFDSSREELGGPDLEQVYLDYMRGGAH